MPFTRVWDSTCPHKYDQWESDGVSYVIQDLPPEDDEEALELLVQQFLPDELLCSVSGLSKDPTSVRSYTQCWRSCIVKRTSLACYAEKNGKRTLAGFNCCFVKFPRAEDNDDRPMDGAAWVKINNATKYIADQCDAFKFLGVDKLLFALGLVVRKEYRGAKLGYRLLAAREPLARSLGIRASRTIFSGTASQKCAAQAGFTTICEVTFKQLADDAGLDYPRDDRVIKLMVKSYAD